MLVDVGVVVVLDLAIFARRDDRLGSPLLQPVARVLAVVALVRDEFGGRWYGFDTALGDLAIMDVSRR